MSTLRNRRSSLHEPVYKTPLSRGRSDFSLLTSRSTGKYDTPKSLHIPRESSSTLKSLPSHVSRDNKVATKTRTKNDFLGGRERTGGDIPSARLSRRRSESDDYRIAARRTDEEQQNSLRDLQFKIASWRASTSSFGSRSSTHRNASITRTPSELTRTPSRSSIGSSDLFRYRSLPDEHPSKLSSLKKSISGRFSSGLSSSVPRPLPSKIVSQSSRVEDSYESFNRGGICGLKNVGNSCYQNSVVQLLNAIPDFVATLSKAIDLDGSPKLAMDMRRLLNEISSAGEYAVMDTYSLRRRLGFLDHKWTGYSQEDAHEFFTEIISALQEDFNRNTSKPAYKELQDLDDLKRQAVEEWRYSKQWNDSEIDDLFGFQTHNQITCPDCHHQSNRFGYLTSLEVPLSDAPSTLKVTND